MSLLEGTAHESVVEVVEACSAPGQRSGNLCCHLWKMKAANKKSDSSSDAEEEDATVYIYDRRKGDKPAQKIRLGGIFNFNAFQLKVQEVKGKMVGSFRVPLQTPKPGICCTGSQYRKERDVCHRQHTSTGDPR